MLFQGWITVGDVGPSLKQHWNNVSCLLYNYRAWCARRQHQSLWPSFQTQWYEYCYTSLSAQSWQYRDKRKPEDGTMPYSYFEWLQGLFMVHSTIGSTVHSRPLNSLEHCLCTTTMTNIRPDRYSKLVPPGYKPQLMRMSHRGRSRRSEIKYLTFDACTYEISHLLNLLARNNIKHRNLIN